MDFKLRLYALHFLKNAYSHLPKKIEEDVNKLNENIINNYI